MFEHDRWKNPNHAGNYHVDVPPMPPSVAHERPCKDTYIGNPIRVVGKACEFCGCHGDPKKGCGCGCHRKHNHGAVCSVVVDDANDIVYLYGDIQHENYHVPGADCVAYAAVKTAGFEVPTRREADEYWEGEQDGNNIRLSHTPLHDNTFMVFLNGVKQREGAEYDFVLTDNVIHFNFYELLEKDRIEVLYTYKDGE